MRPNQLASVLFAGLVVTLAIAAGGGVVTASPADVSDDSRGEGSGLVDTDSKQEGTGSSTASDLVGTAAQQGGSGLE